MSMVGRNVLIKAVTQSISLYAMNCFYLLKTLINDLQSLISNF